MANDFTSNITRKLARVFLKKFESARVLSKNVNTQLLANKFNPSSGDTVDFKRPTDYISRRTAGGDLFAATFTASDIITGKASGVVQPYFTVEVDFQEADQSIKMDQMDELLAPMATRIVTDLEVDFANFMMKNSGLLAGTPGNAVATWNDVAAAGAIMKSSGIPTDMRWNYAVNPFTQVALASAQRTVSDASGAAAGGGGAMGTITKSAHEEAIITANFAGMKVMTATTLSTYTLPADIAGLVNGTPDVTYLTAKDTMTQSVAVDGFSGVEVIPAGAIIQYTNVNRFNMSTRKLIVDDTGGNIVFTGVVQESVTLAAGAGTLIVSGPVISETGGNPPGQYNTADDVIANNSVVTLLGGTAATLQPNLFWHPQAFGIGSVPIAKLFSTDTIATTEDGLQIRVSKGASIRENKQIVRFDLRPAYATLNPFFAGQGFGA